MADAGYRSCPEIMLQQTRVAAVLDYYRRFLEAAPTVDALADLPTDQLMKLWQGGRQTVAPSSIKAWLKSPGASRGITLPRAAVTVFCYYSEQISIT